MQQCSTSRLKRMHPSNHTDSARLEGVGTKKMSELGQHMDTRRQACIDLEKATRCITQALQHEIGRNQDLCVLIHRLEEKEAEISGSLTEQVESNKELKLKVVELQKDLEEKHKSMTQANQTVVLLKKELRELRQQRQSQQSNRTVQDVNEWLQGEESQIRQIRIPSSPLQLDELTAAEEPLVCSEQLMSSDSQIPLVSPDGQIPPVSGIKEENADNGYEECSQYERTEPRTERTQTTYSAADIKSEQIQTSLVSSDGQMLLEAAVSDDEEYGHSVKRRRNGSSATDQTMNPSTEIKAEQGQEEGLNMAPILSSEMDQFPTDPMSQAHLWKVSVVLQDCCRPLGGQGKDEENNRDKEQPGAGKGASSSSSILQIADTEKPYCCSQCGRSYRQKKNLKQHQRTHTGERPYQCAQCGIAFTHKGSLKQHQRIHTGERPYQCSECGKSFTNSGSLKRHEKTHTGEKPYSCSYCSKSFTYNHNLKTHQRIHTGGRSFDCAECGQSFSEWEHLKQHKRSQHTGKGLCHCTQCGKSFISNQNLIRHQRIHTGERPYQCTQCEKTFTDGGTLKRHQRIHTGERPYRCTQCGKSFHQGINLKVHQRTHTKERPYRCTYCGHSFTREDQLQRHQLKFHNADLERV
ncbi:zinc finger protein 436-like isoform X3 [Alosa sapidissima]|uniref:zinc finger protein 436-like isoform X3 n=1 Tax=Alosa sapidissima TaxID=34773 RepID=UPI001C0A415E|nr:zinc finger protein 436-like isoform X3 [Alosa sapidissima]